MWLANGIIAGIGLAAAEPRARDALDCARFPAMNQTYTLSSVRNTPPTQTNFTFFYNPCEPVDVAGCAGDDLLCGVEAVASSDGWVTSAVKPYGSASNGANVLVQELENRLFMHFSHATWSGNQLFASVKVECGPHTHFSIGNDPNGSIDAKLLTLITPDICEGFAVAEADADPAPGSGLGMQETATRVAEHGRVWSVGQTLGIVLVVAVVAFIGGIVLLWLILRLESHENEAAQDYSLADALHLVLSGLAHGVQTVFGIGPKQE